MQNNPPPRAGAANPAHPVAAVPALADRGFQRWPVALRQANWTSIYKHVSADEARQIFQDVAIDDDLTHSVAFHNFKILADERPIVLSTRIIVQEGEEAPGVDVQIDRLIKNRLRISTADTKSWSDLES